MITMPEDADNAKDEDYPTTPRIYDHDNGVDYDDPDPIGEATGSDIL